jgi:glyoxylase-like metal-dependent hydrolase (beta-lactamase superfamily II)
MKKFIKLHCPILVVVVMIFVCLIIMSCDEGQQSVRIVEATESVVTFRIGRFECRVIKDGGTTIDALNFFSGVEPEKISAACEEFHWNPAAVPLSVLVLVVNTGEDLILIDTGLGEPVYTDEGKFIESLSEQRIDPDDVDVVIITHGHWDHIGGIADEEGQLHFPNARHVMSRTAWEFWTAEENLSQMPERLAEWAQENLPSLKGRVELVDEALEILPGISMIAASGHTPGQMAVLVQSDNQKLLCLADAAHNPLQMAYPDIGYSDDRDPEKARSTRWALVKKSISDKSLVFGCHFPFPGLGYVKEINEKPAWQGLSISSKTN